MGIGTWFSLSIETIAGVGEVCQVWAESRGLADVPAEM